MFDAASVITISMESLVAILLWGQQCYPQEPNFVDVSVIFVVFLLLYRLAQRGMRV